MEAKNDDHEPRETKDEPAPPLAPTLKIVAKQFLARRAALGEAALDCDGIECLYGDFVEENADEFEGFDPSDGSGNDHALKALHEEFLELFTRSKMKTSARIGARVAFWGIDASRASAWRLPAGAGLQNAASRARVRASGRKTLAKQRRAQSLSHPIAPQRPVLGPATRANSPLRRPGAADPRRGSPGRQTHRTPGQATRHAPRAVDATAPSARRQRRDNTKRPDAVDTTPTR